MGSAGLTVSVALTLYGVAAVTFMMAMYALERRGPVFILLFALGCVLSSIYGFLAGAWPFGVVELRVGHGLGKEPRRPDEDGEVRFRERPGAGRGLGQDRPQHSPPVRPPRLDPVCDVVQPNQPSPYGVDHEGAGSR